MPLAPAYVGPEWPPPLEAYDYLASVSWRDWAWEGLRRNPKYQSDAGAHPPAGIINEHLGARALLTRMQVTNIPAEAWALCSFRQPSFECARGAPYLDAQRWGIGNSRNC